MPKLKNEMLIYKISWYGKEVEEKKQWYESQVKGNI